MTTALKTLALAGSMLVLMLVGGGTLDVLWGWFIEPVFLSAPDLTLGTALGVSLVVSFFLMGMAKVDMNAQTEGMGVVEAVVAQTFIWLVGYAVLWVMALLYHFVFGIGLA